MKPHILTLALVIWEFALEIQCFVHICFRQIFLVLYSKHAYVILNKDTHFSEWASPESRPSVMWSG